MYSAKFSVRIDRIILAHFGDNASLAVVRDNKPVETSTSFTSAAGAPTSIHAGDLALGLVWYLARAEGFDAKRFNETVHFQSGFLDVSDTSSDTRDLLDQETRDVHAAEATALFCCQVKKWISANRVASATRRIGETVSLRDAAARCAP